MKDVEFLETQNKCAGDVTGLTDTEAVFEYGTNTTRPVSATHNVIIGNDDAGMYELIYTL